MNRVFRLLPPLGVAGFFLAGHLLGFDSRLLRALAPVLALVAGLGLLRPGGREPASPIDKALTLFLVLAALGLRFWPGGPGGVIARAPEVWLYLVLFLAAALPPLAGREPFTTFFARRRTPAQFWDSPQFKAINRHMTWAWAGLFLACALLAAAPILWPVLGSPALALTCQAILPPVLLLGLGLPLNRRYPDFYLRRAGLDPSALQQTDPGPTGPPTDAPKENKMSQSTAYAPIVAINGSPHVGFGNSSLMLEMLRPTLEQEGFALEVINLSERDIEYCTGCAFCLDKGQCWIDDDHRRIMGKLLEAPAVILASPVYFKHVTAQMKTFIDRSLAYGHKPRAAWKPGLALSVSAGMGETDVARYLGDILRAYGAFNVGSLTAIAVGGGGFTGGEAVRARAVDLARDLARAIKDKRRYPASDRDLYFYLFMSNLVRSHGDTIMRHDDKHWQELGLYEGFETYIQQQVTPVEYQDEMRQAWIQQMIAEQKARKKARAGQASAATPAAAQAGAGPQAAGSCRELLAMMPLGFNASAAGDLSATVQFEVSGAEHFTAHLSLAQGRCEFHEGPAPQPTLVIQTPAEVWLAIARGELDGQSAFMQGRYKVQGDLGLLMRFKSLFTG